MLRSLRKRLRQIRYYSATPTRSPWTQAMDVALFASLAIAVAAAALSDIMFLRTTSAWEQHVRLWWTDDGGIRAGLIDSHQVNAPWGVSRPYGEFLLYVPQHDGGLPFASSRRPLPLRTDLDLFTEANMDAATALAPGAPVHEAIEAVAAAHGGRLHALWQGERMPPQRQWGAMAMNVLVWWFAIYVVSTLGIALLRGTTAIVGGHREARKRHLRSIGHCAGCGYDMRGLEFADRCPECGQLV